MKDRLMLLAPASAFVIGLIAIGAVKKAAHAIGFVDHPDRRRKLQDVPVALGGGVAVWLAAWCGWGIGMLALPRGTSAAPGLWPLASLAFASLLVLILGAVDDRRGMRGCHKLAGQVLVAILMAFSGLRIDALGGFGVEFELGSLGYFATILWVVLVINAFNLIDGLDGFCGGVSFVLSLALAFMAYRAGLTGDALLGLALAGALAAFLKDNLPPARIYLGDAGSMTLGAIFAALSLRACTASPGGPTSVPPLVALMALPLLDVATALGRRWLAGRSLFMPDRGHIHHRLRNRLGSAGAATSVAVGGAAFGALGAVVAGCWGLGDGVALVATLAPVAVLVATDTFGGSELRLLAFRFRKDSAGLLPNGPSGRRAVVRHECRLQGGRDWDAVWEALIRSVEDSDVQKIEMAIDMPAAGETYHGLWSLGPSAGDVPHWSVVHSIRVRGAHAGELRVSGGVDEFRERYLDKVENLVRILEGHLEADGPHRLASAGLAPQAMGRVALPATDH